MKMGSSSNQKYPEFFKIFLPDHCSNNIRIPNAFLKHVGYKLPKKVVLRNGRGKLWFIEVAETEDGIFFQKGWSRLVSDNLIQVGEFLFFKYNGNHMFDIKIHEPSGCEKELVGPSVRTMPIRQEEEEMPLEETEQEEEAENEGMSKDKSWNSGKRNLVEQGQSSTSKGRRGRNYSVSGYCPEKVDKGLVEFLPSNNPFFITKLRKTSRRNYLAIPHDIREGFHLKFSDSIKFQDPKGQHWIGEIDRWKDGRVWVKKAWGELCKWNMVGEEDTLICEFTPSKKNTCEMIKVQIIRPGTIEGHDH